MITSRADFLLILEMRQALNPETGVAFCLLQFSAKRLAVVVESVALAWLGLLRFPIDRQERGDTTPFGPLRTSWRLGVPVSY